MRKQKSGWLEIALQSPMCAATGDGIGGLIDTDIAQEYGLPIIPAKRLKGCLLAAGKELGAYDDKLDKALIDLFGRPGAARSAALQVEDAHLYKVPGFGAANHSAPPLEIADYPMFVNQLRHHMNGSGMVEETLSTEDVLTYFSSLRTRTAIDPVSGSAEKTALYTMRTAHKNLIFRAKVTLCDCSNQDHLEAMLNQCVKGLRHIGLGITRGFGEVRCQLTMLQKIETSAKKVPGLFGEEDVVLSYCLDLKTPLLIAGQGGMYMTCEDCIPGSAILGALAGMYIEDHLIDKNNAHADPLFRAIFLRGGIQFGYVFPAVSNQQVFYPCPKAIQRDKMQGIYYNATRPIPEEVQPRDEQRFVNLFNDRLEICELDKEIRMHHARPIDRGIGYAVRGDEDDQNISGDGQFFQYVSISAGQRFCGTWRGSARNVQILLECLHNRGNRLRLGRSRGAEYGDVVFTPESTAPAAKQYENAAESGKQLIFWLTTPLVLCDKAGRDSLDPQVLIDQMQETLRCKIEIKRKFLGFSKLGGYQAKWRLPKQQRNVLAAGTALLVQTERPLVFAAVENLRWGENVGEGCGMIKVLHSDVFPENKLISASCYIKPRPGNAAQTDGNTMHPLIARLLEQKKKKIGESREIERVLKEKIRLLESSVIEKLNKMFYAVGWSYPNLMKEVEKIKDEKKKFKVKEFLRPCEKESETFRSLYLKRAKWEARRASHEREERSAED